jgi:hypothetical protein
VRLFTGTSPTRRTGMQFFGCSRPPRSFIWPPRPEPRSLCPRRPATPRSTWSAPPSCWMRSVGQGWYPTSSSWPRHERSTARVPGSTAIRSSTHDRAVTPSWLPAPGILRVRPVSVRCRFPAVRSTEPRPTNIYGATKLAQEHLAAWGAAHNAR